MGLQANLFTGDLELPPPKKELDQYFTRPKTAQAFADWAGLLDVGSVLEPAAGEGALVKPIGEGLPLVTCVEIDRARAQWLERLPAVDEAIAGNFLEISHEFRKEGRVWDLMHTNPPYSKGRDLAFFEAWIDSKVSQRCTALLVINFLHTSDRYDRIWQYVDLPRLAVLKSRPIFTRIDKEDWGPRRDYAFFEMTLRKRRRSKKSIAHPKLQWLDIAP